MEEFNDIENLEILEQSSSNDASDATAIAESNEVVAEQNNASTPSFAAAQTNPFGFTDVGYSASPTFADIDGDGDLDAFVGNIISNILYLFPREMPVPPALLLLKPTPSGLQM